MYGCKYTNIILKKKKKNLYYLAKKKKKKLILSIIAASQNNFRTNYHILFSAFTGMKVLVARINICVSSDGNGVDHHNG